MKTNYEYESTVVFSLDSKTPESLEKMGQTFLQNGNGPAGTLAFALADALRRIETLERRIKDGEA